MKKYSKPILSIIGNVKDVTTSGSSNARKDSGRNGCKHN